MGNVAFNAELGRSFFEGSSSFRTKDDASDNKSGGMYSHVALEFSATEAAEWESFFLFLQKVLTAGVGAIPVYQANGLTFAKGTLVCPSGYSAAQDAFIVTKADYADVSKLPLFVLDKDLPTATKGMAYAAALVSGLNTSAAVAVGDPVYAGADGQWTLTAPTAPTQLVQEVGRVTVVNANTGAIAFYPAAKAVQKNADGQLSTNIARLATANTFTKTQTIQPDADASKALILKGHSSPTANLLECQSSAGALLRGVGPRGAEIGETAIQSWHAADKPATRLDGTALVAGDRWYEIGTRKWWVYDLPNTRWLSELLYTYDGQGYVNANTGIGYFTVPGGGNIFIERMDTFSYVATTNNAASYWRLDLTYRVGGTTLISGAMSTVADSPDTSYRHSWTTGVTSAFAANDLGLQFAAYKAGATGTPGNIQLAVNMQYRIVHA